MNNWTFLGYSKADAYECISDTSTTNVQIRELQNYAVSQAIFI